MSIFVRYIRTWCAGSEAPATQQWTQLQHRCRSPARYRGIQFADGLGRQAQPLSAGNFGAVPGLGDQALAATIHYRLLRDRTRGYILVGQEIRSEMDGCKYQAFRFLGARQPPIAAACYV